MGSGRPILASTTVALGPLLELTHTIPIVFVNAADPVGGGYVESLARPGGNATGFTPFENRTVEGLQARRFYTKHNQSGRA